MKKFSLLFLTLLLLSCGGDTKEVSVSEVVGSKDLAAIKSKRDAIMEDYSRIQEQLKELDQAINQLDTLKKLPLVTVVTVQDTLYKHYLELQGSVDTKQNLVLYPEFSGVLTRVYVKEGQKVGKGQLLASVDDGGLGQQVAQMEIQSELAKTTFERQKRLWDQKIGSEIQYLQAKSNFEAQEKAVAQMKSQYGKTGIRAPFAGIVDEIISEQGSVVAPGQSRIMRLVSLNDMYIETEVPERYISDLKKGTEVKVNLPVLGKSLDTKVRQVGNFINPTNRSFKIEVAVPNKEGLIKPNLTAKVRINDYTSDKAILIPQSVISENASGEQYAYIATGQSGNGEAMAKKVIIKTGRSQGDLIEVLEGIKSGDAIIKEGARRVKDGQAVRILKA